MAIGSWLDGAAAPTQSRYCETMKNITVSVDEAVHRRARLRAAELNTSLSALVKGFLEDLAADSSEAERRRRLQNELLARLDAQGSGVIAAERLGREAVHQRGQTPDHA